MNEDTHLVVNSEVNIKVSTKRNNLYFGLCAFMSLALIVFVVYLYLKIQT